MRESLAAFGHVFRNRALRRLQLAWAGSNIGAWAYTVAIAVYAYREDGAYAVGLIGLLRWVASGVAAPMTGVLGDRYARVRVMVATDLSRVALLAAMALVALGGASPLAVYALSILGTVIGTAFRPAQAALVPALARTPEELTASNVTASTIESVGLFVGPALGGVLVAVADVEVTFVATAGLLLWSALLVAGVDEPKRAEREDRAEEGLLREGVAGFRTIAAEPRLRVLTGLFAAQTMVDGALGVLVVVLALETLDLGASGVGFLNSASGIGGIVGGGVAALLVSRGRLATDFGLGIALWGLPLVLIGVWPEPALAYAAFTLLGIGNTIVDVSGDTLLQRSVADDVLARVFGAMEGMMLVAIGFGSIAAPVLISMFGVREATIATGAILPLLAVLSWRTLARIDREAVVPTRELELLKEIPIFAPLPRARLECLAGRLAPRRFAAGTTVFRRGEQGDGFYVIAGGEVEVTPAAHSPVTLGPGAFFGEVALLRDVPRTATVVAKTDVDLLELERDEFVSAVTGHVEASRAAEAVIGAYGPALRPA